MGSEITSSAAKARYPGRGFAISALCFVLLYNCGRFVLHARAVGELQSRIYEGAAPLRVAAMPDKVNPLRWQGIVETADAFAVTDLSLLAPFDPTHATVFHKPESDPAMQAAAGTKTFREFLRFSQLPLWRVSPADEPENAKTVEVIDMRFGTPLAPGFMVSALVDARQRVLRTAFRWGSARPR